MHLSSFALCSFHDFSSISCRFGPIIEAPIGPWLAPAPVAGVVARRRAGGGFTFLNFDM
jgi:hypothetical protein